MFGLDFDVATSVQKKKMLQRTHPQHQEESKSLFLHRFEV
jgi:hypothetical protein